jgi:tyrosinase
MVYDPFAFKNNTLDNSQIDIHASLTAESFALTDLAATTVYVRKNQARTDADFQNRFKSAITSLISTGAYSSLVNIHANMSHRMHTMRGMGTVGSLRFAPWHRDYLKKLEVELRVVDPTLFIPYWDWTVDRQIPSWLEGFKPSGVVDANGRPIVITRNPGASPDSPTLPTAQSIDEVMVNTRFINFTLALEGARPFGAHNQVHDWVGGTMGQVPRSPADALFWLHHAFIDLLWHRWQLQHPDQHPGLTGSNAILDPWPEVIADVESIRAMGYDYD